MTRRIVTLLLALVLLASGGCQATPEKGVVASKADGAFQAALADKVSPTLAPAAEQTTAPAVYEDSFDGQQGGSVRFHVKVTEPAIPGPM